MALVAMVSELEHHSVLTDLDSTWQRERCMRAGQGLGVRQPWNGQTWVCISAQYLRRCVARHFASLSLSFLIYKLELIRSCPIEL